MLELQGSAGDTVRVGVPVSCVDYGKPGPEAHTTLSVYPKPVQEQVLRILQVASALREDTQTRILILMHSPVYADVFWNYVLVMWLMESEAIEAEVKKMLELQRRLDAYKRLGRVLLSEEALTMAVQRAVWIVTSDVTFQRLLTNGAILEAEISN